MLCSSFRNQEECSYSCTSLTVNLKTLRDEKREFCLLDVAIVVDNVRDGGDKVCVEVDRLGLFV